MPPSIVARACVIVVGCAVLGGCGRHPGDTVERALAAGRPEEAWRVAGAALREDPSSVAAWMGRARAALATGRTVSGIEAATRAIELSGGDAQAYLIHAYLDQQRLRNLAAVAAADSARQRAPDDVRCVRAAGELRFGGGMVGTPDHDGAVVAFRAAVALDPADVRSRFGLGKALVLTGHGVEGAEWLTGVLHDRPAWGEAHYLLGVARMREHDFPVALDRFESALAFDPTDGAAEFNRARMLDRLGRSEEAVQARERSTLLRELAERVRLAAEKWYATGEAAHGLTFARTLRAGGRWREAGQVARTLTLEFPRLPATHLELAEAALATGDAVEARDAAARALELAPLLARAHLVTARAAEAEGDPDAALASAREAVRREPADPEAAALLAHLLVATGSAADAFAPLDEAVRRGARDIRVAASRAEALVGIGRYGEAQGLLRRMLETQRNAEWLALRGRARQESGKLAGARDDLRAALEEEPRREECWQALADLLENMGQGEEAADCREQAARIRKEDERARRALTDWERSPFDARASAGAVESLIAAGRSAEAGRVTLWTDGFGRRP